VGEGNFATTGTFGGWRGDGVEGHCGVEGGVEMGTGVEVFEGDSFTDDGVETLLVEGCRFRLNDSGSCWWGCSLMDCEEY